MDRSDFSDRSTGADDDYFHPPESSSASNPRHTELDPYGAPEGSSQPQYMTYGTGAQSKHAQALMARLDQDERDSGYGSMSSGSAFGDLGYDQELMVDSPKYIPHSGGEHMTESEKKGLASQIHQLHYNQNRVALAKAIGQTIELLKGLQEMNAQWPVNYPSVQESATDNQRPALQQSQSTREVQRHPARPGLSSSQSTRDVGDLARPKNPLLQHLRPRPSPLRSQTARPEAPPDIIPQAPVVKRDEPRLVTPQIAQEFSILKLDLKVGSLSQAELVHSLEKKSIASLLDGQISKSVRHLLSLRDRIEDTSSKVLVTGDLNAGKSTFCNALLRRKILPEDQQPCTAIFCEVLDAKENSGIEEVHAIPQDVLYDRNDESTYDVYSLQDLEKIVVDNDRYMQCKVYVKDARSIDQSLLNNGVVDIALIDAPGLNSDSVKTTAVFARQEEIDVVVFVVSAANHFTLSAKEFIWQAAHEKAYIFMVVNGFDNIRDKQRCQKLILEQLHKLSPHTFKEASELVHFVSSNAIPTRPLLPQPGGGGSGPGDDGDDDDSFPTGKHDSSADKGKEKDKERIQDFETLESSLRRFVLEKRARSKLAPAKTYLTNTLNDMNVLASVNKEVAQSELDRAANELAELEPQYQDKSKQKLIVSDQLERENDGTVNDIYDHTRSTLSLTIDHVGNADLGIEYPGLFSAFQYADDLRLAMLDQITASVRDCEDYARANTVKGVSMIKSLGLLHVGDSYEQLNFRADMMFSRRRDALARTVDTDVDLLDFFDLGSLWQQQEKIVGSSLALTVVGTLGTRALGGIGWVNGAFTGARILGSRNLQRLAAPALLAGLVALVAYVLSTVPQALPPRLAKKLAVQLATMDYTHANAVRISSEVRRVLKFPAQQLAIDLSKGVEELRVKKEEVTKIKHESEVARKYFTNLVRTTQQSRSNLDNVDLEGPLPGAAGDYVQ